MDEMVLTKEENAFLLETYFSTKSYEMCMEKFDGRRSNKTSILRLVHQFREHSTILRAP